MLHQLSLFECIIVFPGLDSEFSALLKQVWGLSKQSIQTPHGKEKTDTLTFRAAALKAVGEKMPDVFSGEEVGSYRSWGDYTTCYWTPKESNIFCSEGASRKIETFLSKPLQGTQTLTRLNLLSYQYNKKKGRYFWDYSLSSPYLHSLFLSIRALTKQPLTTNQLIHCTFAVLPSKCH